MKDKTIEIGFLEKESKTVTTPVSQSPIQYILGRYLLTALAQEWSISQFVYALLANYHSTVYETICDNKALME